MAQNQKQAQEANDQVERDIDIGKTLTRLSERKQALLEGFAMGLMASENEKAAV